MPGACPQGVAPFPRLGSCYLLTGLSPGPILPSRWDTSLLTKVKYPDDIMKVCGPGGSNGCVTVDAGLLLDQGLSISRLA